MLTVDSLETAYGVSQVLFGVSLRIDAGQVVTLLGRNGMGKTTTVRSIMGIVRPRAGEVRFLGRPIHGLPSYRVAQTGIGLVALMTNPRLLILDEATEGLAPLVRTEIWGCLAHLKARGQSILLIDKDVAALARIADRHYILEKGQIVWSGASAELRARADIQHRYLGV